MRLLLPSPLGLLLADHGEEGVRALRFWPQGVHPPSGTRDAPARGDHVGQRLAAELGEYFRGERTGFSVPLAPAGTAFQRRVWAALREIPYAATRSYAQVAASVGTPRGSRAVGQANGRNPLPILVPCHRVVAADGSLGGYGAGPAVKRWLLQHESSVAGPANLEL